LTQLAHTKNFVKFGHVVFEIYEKGRQTDKQTGSLQYFTPTLG